MQEKIVGEIFTRMEEEGFVSKTEQYEICKRAIQFFGFSYQRNEELKVGTTVDCSTLTSQSHWEGAVIGIPFVADSQRKATSGQIISSAEDLIPGDILVKYPSIEVSPDKTWNHVGLYLGKDTAGNQWLIESTSRTGVRLSLVSEFEANGGMKRFTLSREPFDSQQALEVLLIAPRVPKFGRLGARQYRKSVPDRPVHRGLDLYVPGGTPVYATISGEALRILDEIENIKGVEISGEKMVVRYLSLSGINIGSGQHVQQGDLLGYVDAPPPASDIIYSSVKKETSHLHLEVESIFPLEKRFGCPVVLEGRQYYNHLYFTKTGLLPMPFSL